MKSVNGCREIMERNITWQGAFHKPHSKCIDAIHNILLLRHCVAVFFSILLIPLCTVHSYIFLSFFTSFFCSVAIQSSVSPSFQCAILFAFFNLKKTACNNIHEKRTQNTSFIGFSASFKMFYIEI